MRDIITSIEGEFRRYKKLGDSSIAQLRDEELSESGPGGGNSVAILVWHLSGNLKSRFTNFLTADGEKPWRHRDDEFVDSFGSRAALLELWERGWACLRKTLDSLKPEDLEKAVLIRGEPHSVPLALERSLGHTCYHIGQIVQVARIHAR